MSNEEYIQKWLEGTLSEEEKSVFAQREEYTSLEKLSKAIVSFKAPEFNVQGELQRLQSKKALGKKAKVVAMPWLRPLLQAAAVLIAVAGGFLFFMPAPVTTVKTLAAEKTELYLPDSSAVTLNAFSKIIYWQKSWTKNRHVVLAGEAFFKVAKGSRFDVETATGIVSVLGTQFNVKMRKNYFEVICYEGLVQVQSAGKTVKLSPNKVFRVMNGVATNGYNTAEKSPRWLLHESSFESVPFAHVIEEFERQYNVTITTKNVKLDQLFTGRFVHENISLALQSIAIPLNLEYKIDDDQKNVVLSGEIK